MPELNDTWIRERRKVRGSGSDSALFSHGLWHDSDMGEGRVVARSGQSISGFAYDEAHGEEWGFDAPSRTLRTHRSDSLWTTDTQPFLPAEVRHSGGQLAERISSEALQDLGAHRLNVAIDLYGKALRDLLPAPVRQEVEFVQAEDDSFYRLTVQVEPSLYADAGRMVDLHMRVEDSISMMAPEFEGYFSLRFRGSNGAS